MIKIEVNKRKIKGYKTMIFCSIFLVITIIFLIVNPNKYINSAFNGILIWAKAVLPALFPFFFITKLLTELGGVKILANSMHKFMQKVFHVNGIGSYVFLTSIMSGYPVGAKITSELYEKQMITSSEAKRLVTFTSTSGPLFIIGTVGVGMFASTTMGFIVLISHFLGAFCNGLLYRNYNYDKSKESQHNSHKFQFNGISENILEKSMISAINSVLVVGGYIAIFFILIDIFSDVGIIKILSAIFNSILSIFNISSQYANGLSTGFLEMTRGCYEISTIFTDLQIATVLVTFIITFGGLSTHLQAMTFLQKCNIKISFFLKQKMTHALCACIISIFLTMIFM